MEQHMGVHETQANDDLSLERVQFMGILFCIMLISIESITSS